MAENIKVPGNTAEWLKMWEEAGDHACDEEPETEPCPLLEKHVDKLTNGKSSAKIFVPLCTKSYDLAWLSNKGYSVVGLEVAESQVKGFFEEQKLEYTVEKGLGGKANVYKSKTKKLVVYAADFFDFNKEAEGLFDAVWDRRAMISINDTNYKSYVAVIKSILKPDGRCLFVNADFDRTKNPGPHLVTEQMLKDLYKDGYKLEYVDERTISEKTDPVFFEGFEWFTEKMFLITRT